MDLRVLRHIPEFLPRCDATDLADTLRSPTLLDLRSNGKPPLFVSTLLHGNESSSWIAMRSLLQEWAGAESAPSCMVFIGNVHAARHAQRCLEGQPDYNRIWEGGESEECDLAERVIHEIRDAEPWLVLDIHNNSGPNPHYSVITDTHPETLATAALFSKTAIYACHPKGVMTRRTSEICTSVTIEVGLPSDSQSAVRARNYVVKLTTLDCPPSHQIQELEVFRNHIRVTIDETGGKAHPELRNLDETFDDMSFCKVPTGTCFYRRTGADLVRAWDDTGADRTAEVFKVLPDRQVLRKDVILSMYTRDPFIARQDCLCYFLEPASTA